MDELDVCYEFSERLEIAIAANGYKHSEIARLTSVAPATISQYIKGNRYPDFWRLAWLSKLLDVSVDWLMFGEIHTDTKYAMKIMHSDGSVEYLLVENKEFQHEGKRKLSKRAKKFTSDQQKVSEKQG